MAKKTNKSKALARPTAKTVTLTQGQFRSLMKRATEGPKQLEAPKASEVVTTAAADLTDQARELVERAVGDNIMLGDFGLVDLVLTPAEEEALSAPMNVEEVRIKPTGEVYLPHTSYTRKLCRAFGRTGWQLVPAAKPQIGNGTVVVPYRLHIHGKAVAFGFGEQDFFGGEGGSNRNQTYGDAIESTHASGLRRCCKHINVDLELWDRDFAESFKREHCVLVEIASGKKPQWRRAIDPPLRDEVGAVQPRQQVRQQAPVAHTGSEGDYITDGQMRRLHAIAHSAGRSNQEVKDFLRTAYHIESSTKVKRRDYDTICATIEARGPLVDVRVPR